jgi:hypothetical protein
MLGERPVSFGTWLDMLRDRKAKGDRLMPHEALLVERAPHTKEQAFALLLANPIPTARIVTCLECEKDDTRARARGETSEVRDSEVLEGMNGRPYRLATCRYHTDLEWSKHWQRRWAKAPEGSPMRVALLAEAQRRRLAGREVMTEPPKGAKP